jgi:general stress protein 26
MEPLDYHLLEKEVIELIDRNRLMVLATCAAKDTDRQVTARMMSTIHQGLTIFFQTGRTSVKYAQMLENPCVALCAGNMQIEGAASMKGHPLAPENQFFAEQYRTLHRGSYETYSHLASNALVEVSPTLVTLWKYTSDGKPYRDYLNTIKRTAYREMYRLE